MVLQGVSEDPDGRNENDTWANVPSVFSSTEVAMASALKLKIIDTRVADVDEIINNV